MHLLRPACVVFAALGAGAVVAQADDLSAAKAGLRQRVPEIDRLKSAEQVGESNTGQLVARGGGAEVAQLVAAENADRAVVFAALARQSGGTAEAAGRAFARQIAAASRPGVWLQREDGGWYRK